MAEEGQVWVNGPEVGELDLEHGERREQRSEQSHSPRPEQRADREHEQDGSRVEQRRERAADEVGVVESRVACSFGHCLAEEERERAVRVARPLVRVQRRVLGIEIGPKRRPFRSRVDEGDESLVGVQMVAMVPVEVVEPESERERENRREQHRPREEDRSCAGRRGHGCAASRRFHENPRGPAVGRHRADPSRARDLSGCVRLLVDNDGPEPALLAVWVDELEPVRSGAANLPRDPVAEGIAVDARAREDQVGVALDAVACPTVDVVAEQVDA